MQNQDINFGLLERTLLNISTPWDALLEISGLRKLDSSSSAYLSYFKRFNAKSPIEIYKAISYAKQDKTRKLIKMKEKYGSIPERAIAISNRTLCGRTRLKIAYSH